MNNEEKKQSMNNQQKEKNGGLAQARSRLASFVEYRAAYEALESGESDAVEVDGVTFEGEDDLLQYICEMPLSVTVRSGWTRPGAEMEAVEFEIMLCTGGPACRIIGDIGQMGAPCSPKIQGQDWFTPWETVYPENDEEDALRWFCEQFYFGE